MSKRYFVQKRAIEREAEAQAAAALAALRLAGCCDCCGADLRNGEKCDPRCEEWRRAS